MEFWIVFGLLWMFMGWGRRRSFGVGMRRCGSHGGRSLPAGRDIEQREPVDGWRSAHARRVGAPAPPPPPAESPVARLQREWVEGRLTDAEFERSLDEVYAQAVRR